MALEIRRGAGRTGLRQVGGGGAQGAETGGEAAGDQARILQLADAHRHVEPLGHQILPGVAHLQLQLHLGVEGEKLGDKGGDVAPAIDHGHRHPQQAAGGRLQGADGIFPVAGQAHCMAHRLEVALPRLGEGEGGAIEELAAEGLLELAHLFAQHRLAEAELTGGAGEGARLHHGDEGGEQGEGFLVHVVLDMETMLFREGGLSPNQKQFTLLVSSTKEQPHDPPAC